MSELSSNIDTSTFKTTCTFVLVDPGSLHARYDNIETVFPGDKQGEYQYCTQHTLQVTR